MPLVRVIFIATFFIAFSGPVSASNEPAVTPFSKLAAETMSGISAALGSQLPDYYAKPVDGGFDASNPSQNFKIRFTARGVQTQAGTTRWRMALRSYRYGDALKTFASSAPSAHLNRVEYRRGPITEWYVNGPAGLEQGFTVAQMADAAKGQRLTLALATSGELPDAVVGGGNSLNLTDGGGQTSMRYTGLTVHDYKGKELSARLEVQGRQLLLQVDTAGAVYPLQVQAWIQAAELSASDGAASDQFGWSLGISGNTMVVGAPGHPVGANASQGAAYVFVEPKTGWANMTQVAELTSSDGGANDAFGSSVAISGDTVVVGAPGATIDGNLYQGAAYVFTEPAGGWANMTQTAKLTASDGGLDNTFGQSVAIDTNTVVVGSPYANIGSQADQGAAYAFVKPTSGWANMTQTAELTASDGTSGSIFGVSVSVQGNTIAVGASGMVINDNSDQGSAYVFVEPESGWSDMTQTAELTASDGSANNYFGQSIGLSDDAVVVGAPSELTGAGYVFVQPASGWADMTQTAELTQSEGPKALLLLGSSVSIGPSRVVLGAPGAIIGGNSYQGAVYVYPKPAGGWTDATPSKVLTSSDGTAGDRFGRSVFNSVDVVAGAPYHTVGSNIDQGTGYVLAILNPHPSLTSLSPNNAIAGGTAFSVTVSGSGFIPQSVANWSGSPRATTYVSGTEVKAALLASDIATAGNFKMSVTNPAPGGGTSAALSFTVNNPDPSISSLSPDTATATGPSFALTVNGSNFVSGSIAKWNGTNLATTFVSSTQLSTTVPASDIKTAGKAQVTVFNKAPGGGTSAAETLTIDNPVPSISSLQPHATAAGGSSFTLSVYGSNFVSTSQIKWNGSALTTTFDSGGKLSATVSAADIAKAGTAEVTVVNPTPGGGKSAKEAFTIEP